MAAVTKGLKYKSTHTSPNLNDADAGSTYPSTTSSTSSSTPTGQVRVLLGVQCRGVPGGPAGQDHGAPGGPQPPGPDRLLPHVREPRLPGGHHAPCLPLRHGEPGDRLRGGLPLPGSGEYQPTSMVVVSTSLPLS